MLKRLIIITLIDVVLIILWDYWATSFSIVLEGAIGIIFIVPLVIIISGIVGLILQFRKNVWGKIILINTVIAFAIFLGVLKYEDWKQEHDNYLTFYFSDKDKIYNVILKLNKAELQNGLAYYIYERLGEFGNAGTDLDGTYTINNDTLILKSDKGRVMKIFRKTLYDYPHKGGFIALRNNPD